MTGLVPEPERKEENERTVPSMQVEILPAEQAQAHSSSDDGTGDEDENVEGDVNGYMPLPQFHNNDDTGLTVHSSESEEESENLEESLKDCDREINVNKDLVINTMKGISLSGNCIPPWAEELSENEWDNIVKRTINGEKALPTENSSS